MLATIRWLHKRRANRIIRSINPYFSRLRFVKNLQDRRRRQRCLELLERSSLNPSPRELNPLPGKLS